MNKYHVRFEVKRTVDMWIEAEDREDLDENIIPEITITDLNEYGQDRHEDISNQWILNNIFGEEDSDDVETT